VTTRDLCERAAALVGAAACDDLDVCPYVLHKSELPEPYCDLPVAGWTGPADDLRFRETIADLVGWSGRGPVIVVSGGDWPTVAAIAIHEGAHILESDWTYPEDESRDLAPADAVLAWAVNAVEMTSDWSRADHGLAFHRALFHLVARCPFDPELPSLEDQIPAAESYGWADWYTLRRSFSPEVWERRNEPIRAILADPPPVDAVELFRV
jgi:hypothetical protein